MDANRRAHLFRSQAPILSPGRLDPATSEITVHLAAVGSLESLLPGAPEPRATVDLLYIFDSSFLEAPEDRRIEQVEHASAVR